MRALVLGGAGFIGLHLTRRLLETGRSVTIVDDFSRGRRDVELARLDVKQVAAGCRGESLRSVEHVAKPVHVDVQTLARTLRKVGPPQDLGEQVGADGAIGPGE